MQINTSCICSAVPPFSYKSRSSLLTCRQQAAQPRHEWKKHHSQIYLLECIFFFYPKTVSVEKYHGAGEGRSQCIPSWPDGFQPRIHHPFTLYLLPGSAGAGNRSVGNAARKPYRRIRLSWKGMGLKLSYKLESPQCHTSPGIFTRVT